MISIKIIKITTFALLIFFNHIILNNFVHIKIAICTMAKNENLYLKEYVDYYLNLGVDHIYIYDNNDVNTYKISDIFDKSYKYHITIYDNIKYKIKNISYAFNLCYSNHINKYDWFFMNDIDGYLIIKNNTLKNYLTNKILKNCEVVKIDCMQSTDNNNIYYEKKPLLERFKGPFINSISNKYLVKSNIKGLHYDFDISSSLLRNISCTNNGKKIFKKELSVDSNYEKAYIIQYKYKSTEEYINKLRTDYIKWFDYNYLDNKIEEYFKYNEITLEKIKYIEEELKLDLSKYKKILFPNIKINQSLEHNNIIYNRKPKKYKLKKNLIIGAFENYNWETVEPFFISFKKVGFENSDCIIFVNKIQEETKIKIQSLGVIIKEVPDNLRNYRIINYRWKIYNDFLKENKKNYNIIFTTDLRDSIFQKDVFKYYNNNKSFLGIAVEDGIICNDIFNKEWILNAYGEDVLKIIGNERIICVGTIWGTIDKFSEFSKIMWEKLSSDWSIKFNVIEQGVTNFLIYYAKMFNDCLVKSDNQNGFVMTIGLTKRENINLDSDNNILNMKGDIAAVIHQYDRKADITDIVKKKYYYIIDNNN